MEEVDRIAEAPKPVRFRRVFKRRDNAAPQLKRFETERMTRHRVIRQREDASVAAPRSAARNEEEDQGHAARAMRSSDNALQMELFEPAVERSPTA